MEYGLTSKGFIAKPFQVILEEERELFRQAFGNDIDTSNDSPEGAYIANQAIKMAQMWEMLEGLWLAGDVDTASGVYLDRLAAFVNVYRLGAISTRVYAALWGDEGTSVIAGHLARTTNRNQFALQRSVVINKDNLLGFLFNIAELEADTYSFSVDGRIIEYTADEEDDEAAVRAGLFHALDEIYPGVYASVDAGDDGMVIHSKAGITPFVFFTDDEKIEILSLGALGIYLGSVPGPVTVPVGSLNEIITNVNGLTNIINYATGITGRNTESDTELRIQMGRRQRQASGNEIAVENAIQQLPGVLYARVYSNRSKSEVDGLPPNSFGPVVVGGLDQEIAQTIFDVGPGGIQSYGSTELTVHDSEGRPWPIGFTRPVNRYIWLKIAIERNPEEAFPVHGFEMVKENIVFWGIENIDVGVDFIFQRLNRPIYDVPGIGFAVIKAASTTDLTPPDEEDYKAANIIVDKREIAVLDHSRIEVRELARDEI